MILGIVGGIIGVGVGGFLAYGYSQGKKNEEDAVKPFEN